MILPIKSKHKISTLLFMLIDVLGMSAKIFVDILSIVMNDYRHKVCIFGYHSN